MVEVESGIDLRKPGSESVKIACTSNYITSTLRVLTLGSESDGSCKDLLVQKSVRLILTRYVNY